MSNDIFQMGYASFPDEEDNGGAAFAVRFQLVDILQGS
jgi:hypothetical protein